MKKDLMKKTGRQLLEALKLVSLGCLENSFLPSGFGPRFPDELRPGAVHHDHPSHRHGRWAHPGGRALALALGLVLASAWAAPRAWAGDDLAPGQKWIEQADGGFVFPASPHNSRFYDFGFGGDILLGYRFDRDFSLSTDIGYFDCDQKGPAGAAAGEWVYVPLMEISRLNFGKGWVRPYLFLGAGVAFNSFSSTPSGQTAKLTHSETDLLLAPGVGVLFVIKKDMAVYLQGRVDLDFVSGSFTSSDSPAVFVPLKAGLSFFVL